MANYEVRRRMTRSANHNDAILLPRPNFIGNDIVVRVILVFC
jgi:hypothetical protein